MNTIYSIPLPRTLVSRVLVAGFALASPSLYAQTFAGRDYLTDSPVSIRAFIYPDARKEAIKIRLENQSSEGVRIRIVNEAQQTVYDDYVTKLTYYGRFNVSALSYGAYTLEISNRTARHTQGFRIESPAAGRIVMATQSTDRDSLIAVNVLPVRKQP
ncbi:hypothetical protein [Spirosoma arcticum]